MEAWARKHLSPLLDPLVGALARAGVSPNALTFAGFVINVVAGALIAIGQPFWGGVVMATLGMPFDAVDGAVARKLGKQTKFGAFFDATLDRLAEGALLAGLGYYFAARGDALSVVVTFAALVGSFMVSYARARAEGLGLECRVGLFSRFGRFLLLVAGLLLSPVFPVSLVILVWALAILTAYTTLERIVHVYRETQDVQRKT
ncbi:MAG: CDP-alcohol phosphatidyltransferase family protein [Chloroflexi bacterium]|jgi:CDP-diacylglycerol--glycerol-3-phosphate 3-phosphatidyltransferase|uniref:CDP-alcohol phosphatidyltransferase family protein n=1 Tax=Candidatus Thermofonsia Clade 3 bacterium TaxID=2364212 RepID=A0A2M8QG65_9CHLR|nr:CDP-alcohol phosphatidyltransferase family protein [Candidatus Roseilinea sp. NK_OTU-006]PJF48764.1 MAG: CDP-alcohol phosphatidyltransferase family protein [Candidatus Thermofonsia Clade 3 bacterium]RMG63595.1 MAG: CDP-alcohol phosphatidyltransferase family protein [Chloroflexota bacterium]